MPLRLNVGLNKKVGEPNYGSRGASVNLEVELEADAIRQPQELHRKIQHLFQLGRDAIEQELNGGSTSERSAALDSNGHSTPRPTNGRLATASQCRAIRAIADRQRIDLTARLRETFGVEQAAELSLSEASQLIDELKSPGQPTGGRQ